MVGKRVVDESGDRPSVKVARRSLWRPLYLKARPVRRWEAGVFHRRSSPLMGFSRNDRGKPNPCTADSRTVGGVLKSRFNLKPTY